MDDVTGARPSSGAAILESAGDAVKPAASACSVLAAPEDRRAPPRPRPAVTAQLPDSPVFPFVSKPIWFTLHRGDAAQADKPPHFGATVYDKSFTRATFRKAA